MKSILTWHLLAFSNSFAQRFRFSSDAGTKWLRVNMVSVRVAAYSGGVLVAKIPARPTVALAAVCSNVRRLMEGVIEEASTVMTASSFVKSYPGVEAMLLNLLV